MKDKPEKIEDMEQITGQVETPEPEDKKVVKAKAKKTDDEDEDKEEVKASTPVDEFHKRLKATFKRE